MLKYKVVKWLFSGDVRNDLYVYLQKAEFEWGKKNVEARVLVLNGNGSVIHVRSIFKGFTYGIWYDKFHITI